MNGATGSPGDPPGPPDPPDPLDRPSAEDGPDAPVRISFIKAPIVVLGGVMGLLLAVLTAQVLFVEGEGSTVVTQPVGRTQDEAADGDDAGRQPTPSDRSPGANEGAITSPRESEAPEPSKGAEGAPSAEGTVSSSMDSMDDPAYVSDRIAEGFVHDFRGVIDEVEARCMAEVVVWMIGVDRLWQITQAMADANADPASLDRNDPRFLSDAEAGALNAHLRPCVSEEAARRLNLDDDG